MVTKMQEVTMEYYDCAVKATKDVFQQLCGLEIQGCDGAEEDLTADGAILGIISLTTDRFEWSMVLGIPKACAVGVAQLFAGFEIDFESEDMGDAMGEVANIFAGLVQRELNAKGLIAEISLPSIMRGQNIVILSNADDTKAMQFSSNIGKFWMAIVAAEDEEADATGEQSEASKAVEVPVDQTQLIVDYMTRIKELEGEVEKFKAQFADLESQLACKA